MVRCCSTSLLPFLCCCNGGFSLRHRVVNRHIRCWSPSSDILAAVRLQVLSSRAAELRFLATGTRVANCSPQELNLELAQAMENLMKHPGALDLKSLCLAPGHLCWIIFVDVMVSTAYGIYQHIHISPVTTDSGFRRKFVRCGLYCVPSCAAQHSVDISCVSGC